MNIGDLVASPILAMSGQVILVRMRPVDGYSVLLLALVYTLCIHRIPPGISINYDSIKGLSEALADQAAPVSTTYGSETCDRVFDTISKLKRGTAIFTQPTGPVKCAGAPQKAMWLVLDYWKEQGLYNYGDGSPINVTFDTGLPVMFGVPE